MIWIRATTPNDHEAVLEVHRAAFPTDAEARLVELLLKNGRATVSLVAHVEGQIVGHIVFSPVSLVPASDRIGLGLAPVAVRPELQRQGIGSALIQRGIESCRRAAVDYIVVLGEPAYYRRFGFQTASRVGLRNEYGVDEPFMSMQLSLGKLPAWGLVKYGREFTIVT